MKKIFVSYKDEKNKVVKGYFEEVEQTANYLKIKTDKNELTIPYHRILKIKKEVT